MLEWLRRRRDEAMRGASRQSGPRYGLGRPVGAYQGGESASGPSGVVGGSDAPSQPFASGGSFGAAPLDLFPDSGAPTPPPSVTAQPSPAPAQWDPGAVGYHPQGPTIFQPIEPTSPVAPTVPVLNARTGPAPQPLPVTSPDFAAEPRDVAPWSPPAPVIYAPKAPGGGLVSPIIENPVNTFEPNPWVSGPSPTYTPPPFVPPSGGGALDPGFVSVPNAGVTTPAPPAGGGGNTYS